MLQTRVKDYHDNARQLQIIPLGAKWSGSQDWSLRITEHALAELVAANPSYGHADGDRRQAAYALLGCEDFKNGQKEWLRRLRQGLTTNAEKARGNIRREIDGITDAGERRTEMARAAEEAMAAAGQFEACARREAETGESRLREQAAELQRCEAARDERRTQLEAALAAARDLGPSVLGELAAAIRHMAAYQEREREAIKDTCVYLCTVGASFLPAHVPRPPHSQGLPNGAQGCGARAARARAPRARIGRLNHGQEPPGC